MCASSKHVSRFLNALDWIAERGQLARMSARARVLIKRYEDQRLYDVGLGRYLTIDDLVAWRAMSLCFEVRDAKTGEDVTETVLARAMTK
jgi:polyhydroxyalkanoate synthesis regulator protein